MQQQITIRECVTPEEQNLFWQYLLDYFHRDVFPGEPETFGFSSEYRVRIQALHDRDIDPLHYLLFQREGKPIGLTSTVLYLSEDSKQFILEFCVFPEFRGSGTGKACAAALLDWGKARGAKFFELNADTAQRQRFWGCMGFVRNGRDRWGEQMLLLPPEEQLAFTVEVLTDTEDLWNLESGFLAEIGEAALDAEKTERLTLAMKQSDIIFFVAKRLNRPVGICSVSPHFSTFACRPCAVFDDFFVEPAFRHQGVAQRLATAALDWCREQGYASVTVGCSPGDVGMYRALGFDCDLGTMLAANL